MTLQNQYQCIECGVLHKENEVCPAINELRARIPSTTATSYVTRLDNAKDTNPKDAVGVKKAPLSTVPSGVLMELGVAMLEGARKYGRHNWRVSGVRGSVYYDAVMRHMMAWWEGEDIDRDSGISHVTKAIATLVVLRDSMMQGKYTDDRPPQMAAHWLDAVNSDAGRVIQKYPDAKPAHTNTERGGAK